MAHIVLCPICNKKFDRDKEAYAMYSSRRYAHASCMLRKCANDPKLSKPEIIDPTEMVLCEYCHKPLSRFSDDCVLLREGHYAHKACETIEQKRELTDKEKLYKYIKEKMYNVDYVPPIIQKQIKSYIAQYNYSYSGMLKALIYGIEISKKFKVDLSYPTIGFLPYVYQDAYNYYYALWLAEQANNGKQIKPPEVEQITIKSPLPKKQVKQYFMSILEDDVNGI